MEAGTSRGIEKFVALATVCAYPKLLQCHFREDDLWNGYPEETNAPYGLPRRCCWCKPKHIASSMASIAIYLLPVNLYGPHVSFDPSKSHVIPALNKKMHRRGCFTRKPYRSVGTGAASREFLYVEDCARAVCARDRTLRQAQPVNLGAGREIKIRELVTLNARLPIQGRHCMGLDASPTVSRAMPGRNPRRARIRLYPSTDFETGLKRTIEW